MNPLTNRFKAGLSSGQVQLGIWSTIPSNIVVEMLALSSFDWLMIDTEHSESSLHLLVTQLQAARGSTSVVVRPPNWDAVTIKLYLDAGVQTLLLPMIETADEARRAVAATRYPPRGTRGLSRSSRANAYGRVESLAKAEAELCVVVQLESLKGLANLEQVAAVEGVNGVFIGAADLGADMGHAENPSHPDVADAVIDSIKRLRALGRPPGVLTTDLGFLARCVESGCTFAAIATDTRALISSAERQLASARAAVESKVTSG